MAMCNQPFSKGLSMESRLEELLDLCTRNNRVCPHPPKWAKLWEIIIEHKKEGVRWNPPRPMILARWWDSTAAEKRACLKQHIRWAHEHDILEKIDNFIRNLSEDDWYHSATSPKPSPKSANSPQPAGV
jgi:hypothetical protein